MATRYMFETPSNSVAFRKQERRDAFWAPILNALATVGAAFGFLLYCVMWAALVGFSLGLVYLLVGGILNLFGVFVPGISIR